MLLKESAQLPSLVSILNSKGRVNGLLQRFPLRGGTGGKVLVFHTCLIGIGPGPLILSPTPALETELSSCKQLTGLEREERGWLDEFCI